MLNYQKLLGEYKLTLDSSIIDPAWKNRAEDLQKKIAANQLTDDEIKKEDEALVKLFEELHKIEEIENPEILAAQRKEQIAGIKDEINDAETIEALEALSKKYAAEFPEVVPFIQKRTEKLAAQARKNQDDEEKKFLQQATAEIKAAKYDDLQALGEKYKKYPELVKIINDRHQNEKPKPEDKDAELAKTLRTKKEWSYNELRKLGIEPTGNDMNVAGVKLQKEYLLNIYSVYR